MYFRVLPQQSSLPGLYGPVLLHLLGNIGLINVKEEGWTGFSEEQHCQPEENPVHPDSFTWIYIIFKIGHFGDISDFFLQILMYEEA